MSRIDDRMREKRMARRGAGVPAPARKGPEIERVPDPAAVPAHDAVIFLDGMGTLNGHAARMKGGDEAIEPEKCAIVNGIVAATGARIVVSSSWRHDAGCVERLKAHGLADAFHADWSVGPYLSEAEAGRARRGAEIAGWLARHPEVTRYVILDDELGMLDGQRRRHLATQYATGLTPMHGTFALDVLEREA